MNKSINTFFFLSAQLLVMHTYASSPPAHSTSQEQSKTQEQLKLESEKLQDEIIKKYQLSGDRFYTSHQATDSSIGRCCVFANDTSVLQILKLTVPGRFNKPETVTLIIQPNELVSFNQKPRLQIQGGISSSHHYISAVELIDQNKNQTSMPADQVNELNTYISKHLDDTQGSVQQKNAFKVAVRIKKNDNDNQMDNSRLYFEDNYHLWLPIKNQESHKTIPERLKKSVLQTAATFTCGNKLDAANKIIKATVEGSVIGGFAKSILLSSIFPAIKHLGHLQGFSDLITAGTTTLHTQLDKAELKKLASYVKKIESLIKSTDQEKQRMAAQEIIDKLKLMKHAPLQNPDSQTEDSIAARTHNENTSFNWHQATENGAGRCWIFSNNTDTTQSLTLEVPGRLYGSEKIELEIKPGQLVSFNRKPHIVPFGSLESLHTYVLNVWLGEKELAQPEVKKLNDYIAYHLSDKQGGTENLRAHKAAITIENEQSLKLRHNALKRDIAESELAKFDNSKGYCLFLPTTEIEKRPFYAHFKEPGIAIAKQMALPLGFALLNYGTENPLWYTSGTLINFLVSSSGSQNLNQALKKTVKLFSDAHEYLDSHVLQFMP